MGNPRTFVQLGYLDPGQDPSTGLGPLTIALIVLAALAVAALVAFLVRRLATRPCPRCGRRVRTGRLECGRCGFDFRAL